MAAAILKSKIADKASVTIVKTFVEMRRFLAANAHVFQRLETIEFKLLEADQNLKISTLNLKINHCNPSNASFSMAKSMMLTN